MAMENLIETNQIQDRLPPHLKQYIKPQIYSDYTPINQAVWRHVMSNNVDFLGKVAHENYLRRSSQLFLVPSTTIHLKL